MEENVSPERREPAWVKLWTPRGIDVRLPIPFGEIVPVEAWQNVLASIENAMEAGWSANEPSLAQGETVEEIGWVVRRQKENKDGSLTDTIDLYSSDDQHSRYSFLTVYLNTPEAVAVFEQVSGLKVSNIPLYIGNNKIERGKSRQTDQLVVKSPHTFKVVYKKNPKYDPNETDTTKKKPARLFVRWHGVAPTKAAEKQSQPPAESPNPIKPVSIEDKLALLAGSLRLDVCHKAVVSAGSYPADQSVRIRKVGQQRAHWLLMDLCSKAKSDEEIAKIDQWKLLPEWEWNDEQLRDLNRAMDTASKCLGA